MPNGRARDGPAQQVQRLLDRFAGGAHVAALERELAELPLDLGAGHVVLRQRGRGLKVERRLVVAAAQHEHVAEALRQPFRRGAVRVRRAARRDAILLLGDLQRVLGARPLRRRERVGQRPVVLPRGVVVIGEVERVLGIELLDAPGRPGVEILQRRRGQAHEQRLAQLVVDEHAAVAARLQPHHLAPPAELDRLDRLARRHLRQRRGRLEIERLAEHRADGQQPLRGRGEPLQPAREERRRPAPRLRLGQERAIDLPPRRRGQQRAALDQPVEHGRGHERDPLGQLGHHGDDVVRQRTGHRLDHAAQLAPAERGERDVRLHRDAPERVVRLDLLGPERGHQQRVRPGAAHDAPALPVAEELRGELVGPLEVVDDDHGRAGLGAQRVEQRRERGEQASLGGRLRTERAVRRRADEVGQDRQHAEGRRVLVQLAPQAAGELGVGARGGHDLAHDPLEHVQRPLRRLVHPAPAQHPRRVARAAPRQLLEQPCLAAPGQRLEQRQPPVPLPRPRERARQLADLGLPPDERRLGEVQPLVVDAGDDLGIRLPARQRARELLEIGGGGRRRLVAVARLLAQEAARDLIERVRRVGAHGGERGRLGGEVQAEKLADVGRLERPAAGHALVEDQADRVEIRSLVDAALEDPRLLRRHVVARGHGLVEQGLVGEAGAGDAEVDEDAAGRALGEDDVGRLHVAVDDAVAVGAIQVVEHAAHHGDGLGHGQRAAREALRQRRAGDELAHDEAARVALLLPGEDAAEPRQHVGLVLELKPPAGGDRRRRDRLDDDLSARDRIAAEEGDDAARALERPRGLVAGGERVRQTPPSSVRAFSGTRRNDARSAASAMREARALRRARASARAAVASSTRPAAASVSATAMRASASPSWRPRALPRYRRTSSAAARASAVSPARRSASASAPRA